MPEEGVVVLGADGGEPVPNGKHRILAELPQLEAIELRFGPDFEGVEPHEHARQVDAFYVLAGEAEFVVGDDVLQAGPGSFVAAPPGLTHGFRNVGGTELRLLNIHAPHAGFSEWLRQGAP